MIVFQLTDEQKRAIAHNEGNMLILACAGSGKTTVVTRRIVRLIEENIAKPDEIVAITFTVKAAEHMKNEIVNLLSDKNNVNKMFVGTIHSFCFSMLKDFYADLSEYYQVIEQDQQYLILYRNYKEWGIEKLSEGLKRDIIDRTLQTINLMKTENLQKEEIAKKHPLFFDIFKKYNATLKENKFLDFSDLLEQMLFLLKKDNTFREFVSAKLKFLIVDEYQDVDKIQEEIIEYVSKMKNVCVVGDDDQCIYQFRGTDVSNMKEFEQKFTAITYPLTENRRSGKNIIDFANGIIKLNNDRIEKEMRYTHIGGVIEIDEYDTIWEEIEHVIQTILRLNSIGIPLSEMAILLRSVSTSGEPYIEALKKAGIHYVAKGDCGLFKTPEILALSSVFEFLIQEDDGCIIFDKLNIGMPIAHELAKKASKQNCNLSKDELVRLGVEEDDARILSDIIKLRDDYRNAKYDGISDLLFRIIEILGLVSISDDIALLNIGEFSKLIRNFEQIDFRKNVKGFVGFFTIYAKRNFDEASFNEVDVDAVRVLTIHQVKGLEFDVVFCPMLVDRRFPILNDKGRWVISDDLFDSKRYNSSLEDERRLFYVAITRAKKFLYLSAAKDIGLKNQKKVSEFLIEAKSIELGESREILSKRVSKREIMPIETSFSQLEYYLTCPYRYKLRIKSGILPQDNPFFQYGQVIHRILKLIHEKSMSGTTITTEMIDKLYKDNFYMRLTIPSYVIKRQEISGLNAIEKYVKSYSATFKNILFAEKEFVMIVENDRIIGRFDLIKKLPNNSIEIVDFKTGTPKQYLRTELQMRLYALAAENYLKMNVRKCTLHYIEHDAPEDVAVSSLILKQTEQTIKDALEGIKNKEFDATPGDQCTRCEYRKICKFVKER